LVRKGLEPSVSADLISNYLAWEVIENREWVFRNALAFQSELGLSFWDASILAAAVTGGVEELWSEDFQDGRTYHGVRIVNPFKD